MQTLRICMAFLLGTALLGLSGALSAPKAHLYPYNESLKKPLSSVGTIVLDPGHGGKDEGARGHGQLKEKDVALAIALALKDELVRSGFRVILTRSDDRYLSLQERAQAVSASGADLLLSIHANAAKNKLARGYETFYLADPSNDPYDPDLPATQDTFRYENFVDTQKEMGKLFLNLLDRASSEDRAKSIELADLIHEAMKGRLLSRDRGVKRAGFFVLKKTEIPAVLIEVGFLSNPKEESLLASARYHQRIARAITGGFNAFRDKQSGVASQLVSK